MRRFLPLFVAFAALASACGGASSTSVDEVAPGDDNPSGEIPSGSSGGEGWPHDFVATGIDGTTIDAGDYEGQDLVLWFWAPW
jgi:hypothetical protein